MSCTSRYQNGLRFLTQKTRCCKFAMRKQAAGVLAAFIIVFLFAVLHTQLPQRQVC